MQYRLEEGSKQIVHGECYGGGSYGWRHWILDMHVIIDDGSEYMYIESCQSKYNNAYSEKAAKAWRQWENYAITWGKNDVRNLTKRIDEIKREMSELAW